MFQIVGVAQFVQQDLEVERMSMLRVDKIQDYHVIFVLDGQMCSILGSPAYRLIYAKKDPE